MQHISAQQLCEQLKNCDHDECIFLDVRGKSEHQEARIEGVKNIPLDELEDHLDELKHYKKIFIHCAGGTRSQRACEFLESHGIYSGVNVEGGLRSWQECQYPIIKG